MDIKLINYEDEHQRYIEYWEKQGEMFKFPGNTRLSKLYMIKFEGKIVGCTWLTELDLSKPEAILGVYLGERNYSEKGLGQYVVKLVLNKAFNEFSYSKLSLHVQEKNKKAVNCYKKCGFKKVKDYPLNSSGDSGDIIYEMSLSRSKFKR